MGGPGEDGQLSAAHRAAAAVVAAGFIAGCGGDGLDRSALVDSFVEANPEASAAQGGCVVDALTEIYGPDRLAVQLGASPLDAAFEEEQFRQMFLCGVEGDVREQLVTQLVDGGVAESDAPCVAESLMDGITDADIDVLLSGEITEAFSEKFYDALEGCDAL